MIVPYIAAYSEQFPEKIALKHKARELSYRQLYHEIASRAKSIQQNFSAETFLLADTNELENLLNFLAIIGLGHKGIFAPKQYSYAQLQALATSQSAQVLRDLAFCENSAAPFVAKVCAYEQYFLGILSSGSSGEPKLIWKDYQSWFSAFPAQSATFGISAADHIMVLDALAYSANLNSLLHGLWLGASICMASIATANTWGTFIENEAISSIFLVPSHYRLLPKNQPFNQVKSLVSAGEKLDVHTCKQLLQSFPNALLSEYYGSAELGHISYQQDAEILENPLAVGRAFPGVHITIKQGHIFVDSPYVSPEYRLSPTNNDLGYLDGGSLILLGRQGRMFNRRGLNVFAEEIENLAARLTFVAEVALVGQLQADLSHELTLFYSHRQGFQNNSHNKQIVRYLAQHLQVAKIPSRIVELVGLPHKNFGKIDYQALLKLCDGEALPA